MSIIKPGRGWVGVDLDGTLAHYDGWKSPTHIGEPVPAMVTLVKKLIAEGWEVRIFTARVSTPDHGELVAVRQAIERWTREHIGRALQATCCKDFAMVTLYDDRAIQVEPNTGRLIGDAVPA
jgi:hypothetical protein